MFGAALPVLGPFRAGPRAVPRRAPGRSASGPRPFRAGPLPFRAGPLAAPCSRLRSRRACYRRPANRSSSGKGAPVVSLARTKLSLPKAASAMSAGILLNHDSWIWLE